MKSKMIRSAARHNEAGRSYRQIPEPLPEGEVKKAQRVLSLLYDYHARQEAGWESNTRFGKFLKFVDKCGLQAVVETGARVRGWNQRQLAERVGVCRGTLYRHLKSRTTSRRTMVRYASALGLGSVTADGLKLYVFPDEVYWLTPHTTEYHRAGENNGQN